MSGLTAFKKFTQVFLIVIMSACLAGCSAIGHNLSPGEDVPSGDSFIPSDPTQSVVLQTTPLTGNTEGPLKPVCFLNMGTIAATIMPWTYIPLNTESAAMPPNASTVASPGGNSSACLSLPLGTYSWCYHWELGDVNDDGMIEYMHTLWLQRVVLDESDTDDMDLAEKITLTAPAGLEEKPGQCPLDTRIVLDIRPFIVDSQHLDSFFYGYSVAGLAHNEDYVTLKGPITVDYFFHHCDAAPCTTPVVEEPPIRVIIPAGETHQFYLEDTVGEHLGNWDMYIQLISIDE